jgi:hypothetical protein
MQDLLGISLSTTILGWSSALADELQVLYAAGHAWGLLGGSLSGPLGPAKGEGVRAAWIILEINGIGLHIEIPF